VKATPALSQTKPVTLACGGAGPSQPASLSTALHCTVLKLQSLVLLESQNLKLEWSFVRQVRVRVLHLRELQITVPLPVCIPPLPAQPNLLLHIICSSALRTPSPSHSSHSLQPTTIYSNIPKQPLPAWPIYYNGVRKPPLPQRNTASNFLDGPEWSESHPIETRPQACARRRLD
jgi:hypothetical protein